MSKGNHLELDAQLKFFKSQAMYYRENLRNGSSRDWDMITGLMHHYESKVRQAEEEIKQRTTR